MATEDMCFISGTASSIDHQGHTLYPLDYSGTDSANVRNVEANIVRSGAGFGDLLM
jgi:hypothetical protein